MGLFSKKPSVKAESAPEALATPAVAATAAAAAPAEVKLARHSAVLGADNLNGYRAFQAGSFEFHRDEY
ncbi:MAG: hypothetical protein ABUS57_14870, partial [Pseudomonadota bacterium]